MEEWQIQTLREDSALSRLAADWNDLYERSSPATPFVSHAWLQSWWQHYGRPGRLVVITVWRTGLLVGAVALMRRHRCGLPVLTPVGAGISDFNDVLLDDSCAEEAARRLARELANQYPRHTIDLPEVRDAAAAWRLAAAGPLRARRLRASTCLELPALPVDELIGTLPARTAKTRRTKRRKIQAAGIRPSRAAGDRVAAAVAVMMQLHRQQWQGRGLNPEHGRARFDDHLRAAVPAMVERGQAQVVEYHLDNEIVAVDLALVGRTMLCAYLYGHRPDLRKRVDVTQLLLSTALDSARGLGLPTLSLLRGDEPYKRRWRPRESHNRRLLLARGGGPSTLYAAGVRGRNWLASLVKTRFPVLGNTTRRVTRWRPSFM